MTVEVPKPKLSRVQKIVKYILEDFVPPGIDITTWGADIDYRTFPYVNIRRLGGSRDPKRPTLLGLPVIELTAYTDTNLPDCENLYDSCLEEIYRACRYQVLTPYGYLSSVEETMGATQFSSLFQGSFRIQGLIKLGIRPPNY